MSQIATLQEAFSLSENLVKTVKDVGEMMQTFEEAEQRMTEMSFIREYPAALTELKAKFEINSEFELQIVKSKFVAQQSVELSKLPTDLDKVLK